MEIGKTNVTIIVGFDMNKSEPHPRAMHFKEARDKRLLEISEDYTELINELIERNGQARICDIAREMGVSHVSVIRTIKRLTRNGYLYKNSHHVELTPKGKETAIFSKKKHLILTEFLLKLGVPESIVATDVEGIEHYISPLTLESIHSHMKTLN